MIEKTATKARKGGVGVTYISKYCLIIPFNGFLSMGFTIVTVCVNYLDFLSATYAENKDSLSGHDYWIITSSADTETQKFCTDNGINCHVTDVFYRSGNSFNKGAAINSLFLSDKINMSESEWILMLDADIIVKNLIHIAWHFDKEVDCLYSCGRKIYNTKNDYINQNHSQGMCHFLGYFQLFHKKHVLEHLNKSTGFLYEFRNGSYYDCEFAKRFTCQKCLPEDAVHLGPIYLNWDGRISPKWI